MVNTPARRESSSSARNLATAGLCSTHFGGQGCSSDSTNASTGLPSATASRYSSSVIDRVPPAGTKP